MLIDTHAHLDLSTSSSQTRLRGAGTDDLEDVLGRAKDAGVNKIICVGTSVEASRKSAELAGKYSKIAKRHSRESGNPETRFRIKSGMTEKSEMQIYATVGIHPEDGKSDIEKYGLLDACIYELRKIVDSSGKVVGVGECGLDYRLTTDNLQLTTDEDKEFQRELFRTQIELADELKLPLVVHCRNGWDEIFDLLEKYPLSFPRKRESRTGFRIKSGMTGEGLRGVFHSWTGDWEAAERALALGFYISFSGIVTFANAGDIQQVAKRVPIDRMLLETDSPFLSPEPMRGKTNEPKNVKIVAEFIARLKDLSADRLADVTSKNAGRLFNF